MKEQFTQPQEFQIELNKIVKQGILAFLLGGSFMTFLYWNFQGLTGLTLFRIGVYQGLIWVILWIGNGLLNTWLDTKISWLKKTEWRFIVGVVATVVYTVGALCALRIVWNMTVFGNSLAEAISYIRFEFFVSAIIITLIIGMFLHGRAFLKEWRNSASEAERLRTENLKARFETLKNQVNPHFLFNSFNVLSTLVHKDPNEAERFIKEMSNLYRYVLETQDKETVLISREMEALHSFAFLSKIRFGDSLEVEIDLEDAKDFHIPPMTLQMLVENAIKHNVVSNTRPLKVQVIREGDSILVQNNLQRKNNVLSSNGIGLPNIQARYEYLSDHQVKILENNHQFIVKIPLISYENYSG